MRFHVRALVKLDRARGQILYCTRLQASRFERVQLFSIDSFISPFYNAIYYRQQSYPVLVIVLIVDRSSVTTLTSGKINGTIKINGCTCRIRVYTCLVVVCFRLYEES